MIGENVSAGPNFSDRLTRQRLRCEGCGHCVRDDFAFRSILVSAEPFANRPYGFEFRLGSFAHGVGSVEANTFDASLQVVLPKLLANSYGLWNFLTPTPMSAESSIRGPHQSVRAGLLWQTPFTEWFFGEIFFGGAYHDGSMVGDATHNALGSHVLFNVGGSIGYRFTPRWSVLVTFRISNDVSGDF